MTLLEAIARRKSTRNFAKRPILEEKLDQLEKSLAEKSHGPFGNPVRFSVLRPSPQNPDALQGLGGAIGTYGFIKNAQAFVVGAVEPSQFALHDYGYLMEGAVLETEQLGLGSCWLGGSFRPGPFGRAIGVRENEFVPAVIALGYPEKDRRLMDRLIRLHHNKGNRRADWKTLFFDQDSFGCPTDPEAFGESAALLRAVHVAPSSCNTQPWRMVRAAPDCFHFFFARNQRYSQKDKLIGNADLQLIDMGIAMRHFDVASQEIGLPGGWSVLDTVETTGIPPGVVYLVSWSAEGR
jgi:nitroreductase